MNDSTTHEFRPIALLASMAHTRLELAALDVEAHVADSVGASGAYGVPPAEGAGGTHPPGQYN